MNILDYIPFGRENAVTRRTLRVSAGVSDRKMRNLIEEARAQGNIIINLQDGSGYYQTDDLDDIESQYRLNNSRAMSVLVQQKHLRQRLKEGGRL